MLPNRREFLKYSTAAVLAPAVAGCVSSSDDGNGGGEGGTPTATPTPEGTTLTDIVGITSHAFRGPSILEVTVENKTEDTLDLVQVEANLYQEDTRLAHSYTNISSLAGGVKQTSEIQFLDMDFPPCDTTRYDLVPNFYYDSTQYEERYEYEYNPEFCD